MSQTFDPIPETSAEPIESSGNSLGCYIYGCLGAAAFMILLALCSGFGLYYFVTGQVEKYTSTEATELPSIQYSEEQLAELHERIERFRLTIEDKSTPADDQVASEDRDTADASAENPDAESVPEGEQDVAENAAEADAEDAVTDAEDPASDPLRELVLTADDINALISEEEAFRDRVYITIKEGEITGQISVPTEKFLPGSKGRFFNASVTLEVTLEDGVLIVTMNDAEVKGEKVPEAFMQEIRKENLAKDLYKDKENARMIARFERITVEDEKIVAKLRED